jgi:hypothetical protein
MGQEAMWVKVSSRAPPQTVPSGQVTKRATQSAVAWLREAFGDERARADHVVWRDPRPATR